MAFLDSLFAALPGAMQVGGSLLQSYGQMQAGSGAMQNGLETQAAMNYQAAQLRVNAGQDIASSQNQAAEIGRQEQLVQSRSLAVAAASGGGASDPTIINMMARNAGQGAYQQALALYGGSDKARTMNSQAEADVYSGNMAEQRGAQIQSASDIGATTTLMKGASSLYSKYGGGGPSAPGYGMARNFNGYDPVANNGWGIE